MNVYQYFPYFVASLSGMLYRSPLKPLSNFGVHENWCSESHSVVGGVSDILTVSDFHPVWKKFGAGNVHEGVLRESSPGNQSSDSHTVLRGVNEFVSVLAALII